LRGLQPLHDLFVVVPRRQRRDVGEGGFQVPKHPRCGLQREVRLLDERVGAPEQLVEAVEAVAAIPRFGLAGLLAALRLAGCLGLVPRALFGSGLFGGGLLQGAFGGAFGFERGLGVFGGQRVCCFSSARLRLHARRERACRLSPPRASLPASQRHDLPRHGGGNCRRRGARRAHRLAQRRACPHAAALFFARAATRSRSAAP
jgi:hypothetical protein